MANVNKDQYRDMYQVLGAINGQATGKTGITPVDEREYVSVAQTTLALGYEPTLKAMNNVGAKTIFSGRPYSARFKGLEVTNEKYGDIVRKITILDGDPMEDTKYDLVDGQSIDDMKVTLDKVVQTNMVGFCKYKRRGTVLRDQIDSAMESSAQLGSFYQLHYQTKANELEMDREAKSRLCLNNLIAGTIKNDTANPNGQIVHLLTEYYNETGVSLTKQDMLKPANARAFGQWAFAYLDHIADKMGSRSEMFHQNFTNKTINRFTPKEMMNVFLLSKYASLFDCMVSANTYDNSFFKRGTVEYVDFWQSIKAEDSISVIPTTVDANGELVEDENETAIEKSGIIAVFTDKEAAGISFAEGHITSTPMNADGDYFNNVFHEKARLWNDFTENTVVVVLD